MPLIDGCPGGLEGRKGQKTVFLSACLMVFLTGTWCNSVGADSGTKDLTTKVFLAERICSYSVRMYGSVCLKTAINHLLYHSRENHHT